MSTPKWKPWSAAPRWARRAQLIAVWVAVVLAWEGAYRVVGWRPWIFPAPSHVLDATLGMLNVRTGFGEPLHGAWPGPPGAPGAGSRSIVGSPLVVALGVSGARLAVGFGASMILGLVVGIGLWRSAFLNSLLGPLFLGLQTLPSVCWVPLAVLILGINERGILFVLVMGSAFSMAIAMRDGLRSLPPIYRAAGRMMGARGWRLYVHVLLPASLPALVGMLRQGFSFAWRSLLGAELILMTQRRGVGFLLSAGREFADVAQVVAVMGVMVAVGMVVDRWVFAVVEQRVRTRFGLVAAR
ncbi:MAG TPA: ABC transporter permease subunit [Phycisphaerales bacterium]|nr:ABC transporter permease subunit [Phycisphaerales bacterium]